MVFSLVECAAEESAKKAHPYLITVYTAVKTLNVHAVRDYRPPTAYLMLYR